MAALLTFGVYAWGSVDAGFAQQGLTLGADLIFYGDNTEFRNPFREGETIFGAAARLDGSIEIGDRARVSIGVFGNQRFGSETAFERVRPILSLAIEGRRSAFVFGTLRTPRAVRPAGPDRTGPHGLVAPLQRETLAFERPYEAGLQWSFTGLRLEHDIWLNWQRLNTPAGRERLDAGARASWHLRGPVSLPVQAHIVHEGGQLFAAGPVRDSLAVASGIVLTTARSAAARPLVTASLELLGLWSRYTPDRQIPEGTRDGGAFFGRSAVETRGWRVHLIAWRGDDFIKDEGDPNYLSIRRDGSRYRGVRDYAEAGVTRTFELAPDAWLEASFRYHRVERHYEYSYRVVAIARARVRAK